jgi:small-conductance mechanosensitive channel
MLRRLLSRRPSPFESRTAVWREVGLGSEIDTAAARRGRGAAVVALALIAAVLVVFDQRKTLFPGHGQEIRIATVILLVLLGWALARSLGRGFAPTLYRRLEPSTAGTIGFLLRLLTIVIVAVVALRIAGVKPAAIVVGGGFTAVVFGLAAQQVLGNMLAGLLLITNRPFRVGERVRLQGGGLAGQTEGVVGQLGLFYTTFVSERVEFRARFGADVSPRRVQEMIENAITVPLRYPPHIGVEELDRDEVVVRIVATPINRRDGSKLAEEVLAGVRATNSARSEPEQDSNGHRSESG